MGRLLWNMHVRHAGLVWNMYCQSYGTCMHTIRNIYRKVLSLWPIHFYINTRTPGLCAHPPRTLIVGQYDPQAFLTQMLALLESLWLNLFVHDVNALFSCADEILVQNFTVHC